MNNITKKGDVAVNGVLYERFAIKTHFIKVGESYLEAIEKYVLPHVEKGDLLAISEKIISISQGRVIEKKDVKIGFWAKTLCKFVMKTTAGFSVGNVYKMQVAIDLAGLPRILFAAFCSALTKPFGIRGVFYRVVGNEVNGLDGFYGGAFKDYEELGILNPENPDKECEKVLGLHDLRAFVVDSNDLGCNLLGTYPNSSYNEEEVLALLKGNPAGQTNQCTPFILIRKKKNS